MSKQDKTDLFNKVKECIIHTQYEMLKRKALLGESVIIADSNGKPIEVSAEEAIKSFNDR